MDEDDDEEDEEEEDEDEDEKEDDAPRLLLCEVILIPEMLPTPLVELLITLLLILPLAPLEVSVFMFIGLDRELLLVLLLVWLALDVGLLGFIIFKPLPVKGKGPLGKFVGLGESVR